MSNDDDEAIIMPFIMPFIMPIMMPIIMPTTTAMHRTLVGAQSLQSCAMHGEDATTLPSLISPHCTCDTLHPKPSPIQPVAFAAPQPAAWRPHWAWASFRPVARGAAQLLNASGLVDALHDARGFTFFAPTDEAFPLPLPLARAD